MQKLKAFTAFLTLTAFSLSGTPLAQAQGTSTTSATTVLPVPNYAPADMSGQLGAAQVGVNSAMSACDATQGLNLLTRMKNKVTGNTPKPKAGKDSSSSTDGQTDGDCQDAKAKGKSYAFTSCNLSCAEPTTLEDGGSCDDPRYFSSKTTAYLDSFGDASSTHSSSEVNRYKTGKYHAHDETQDKALAADVESLKKYVAYQNYLGTVCAKQSVDDVMAMDKVFECKMKALSQAETAAANALHQALAVNTQNYTKMMQFQSQVSDQVAQITGILGAENNPDTLLGVRKTLRDESQALPAQGKAIQAALAKVDSEKKENEQTLESDRMTQVDQCMEGNAGGTSFTCLKRVQSGGGKDSSGNATAGSDVMNPDGTYKYVSTSCGGMDYLKSMVEQTAYPVIDGRKVANAASAAKAQQLVAQFQAKLQIMEGEMGTGDQVMTTGSNGQATASGSKLAGLVSLPTAGAFDARYLSLFSSLPGFDSGRFQQMVSSCYNRSQTWKTQQLNSAGSKYNQTKQAIAAERGKEVSAPLAAAVVKMNSEYTTAMGFLTSQSNIPPFMSTNCSQAPDSASAMACFNSIQTGLNNILNGGGTVGVTTKPITGGSLVPAFSVACKGIEACVQSFQQASDQKKVQLGSAVKQTTDMVNNGNTEVQNQLSSFAMTLSQLQSQVKDSFDSMRGMLGVLGVSTDAELNMIKPPEPLQPSRSCKDGQVCPFDNPTNMAAALSSMVQPGGLVDFNNPGVKDLLKDAQAHAKDMSEKMADKTKTAVDAMRKLSSLDSECTKDDPTNRLPDGQSPTSVVNVDDLQNACRKAVSDTSCATPTNTPAVSTLMSTLSQYIGTDTALDATAVKTVQGQVQTLAKNGCYVTQCTQFATGMLKNQQVAAQRGDTQETQGANN